MYCPLLLTVNTWAAELEFQGCIPSILTTFGKSLNIFGPQFSGMQKGNDEK